MCLFFKPYINNISSQIPPARILNYISKKNSLTHQRLKWLRERRQIGIHLQNNNLVWWWFAAHMRLLSNTTLVSRNHNLENKYCSSLLTDTPKTNWRRPHVDCDVRSIQKRISLYRDVPSCPNNRAPKYGVR